MRELAQQLTPTEKHEIAVEIRKLFAFQDKMLNDDKLNFFVFELARGEFPFAAVMKGIRDMHGQDLSRIKLLDIKNSIRSGISWISEETKIECPICQMTGRISMQDSHGNKYTLGCRCPNGRSWAEGVKCAVWNGRDEQFIMGRNLVMVDMYKKLKGEKESNVHATCASAAAAASTEVS